MSASIARRVLAWTERTLGTDTIKASAQNPPVLMDATIAFVVM